MKRLLLALVVVGLVSLTASTCFASIAGPHWPTGEFRTMSIPTELSR